MEGLLEERRIPAADAACGIGFEAASSCRVEGAEVPVIDEDASELANAVDEFGDKGENICIRAMDRSRSKPGGISGAPARIMGREGPDTSVNNATIPDIAHSGRPTADRPAKLQVIDLTGALRITPAIPLRMRSSSSFSAVYTLSIQSIVGIPCPGAFATAKCGIFILSMSMADNLGSEGNRAKAVAQGFIETCTVQTEGEQHRQEVDEFGTHHIGKGRNSPLRSGAADDRAGIFFSTR